MTAFDATFLFWLAAHTLASAYCGWCLCLAAHRETPPPRKCNDAAFEYENAD